MIKLRWAHDVDGRLRLQYCTPLVVDYVPVVKEGVPDGTLGLHTVVLDQTKWQWVDVPEVIDMDSFRPKPKTPPPDGPKYA
ncbi:hypothetical protein EBT16_06430 [bacterium]|nr:hypothetical protein [bacterium]